MVSSHLWQKCCNNASDASYRLGHGQNTTVNYDFPCLSRYGEALDAALGTRDPSVVASVLEELTIRGGLNSALGNRDSETLVPLLSHLCKYIGEPRYTKLLSGVTHRILDAYAEVVGASEEVDSKLWQLKERIMAEVRVQDSLLEVQGMLEPIIAAAMEGLSIAG